MTSQYYEIGVYLQCRGRRTWRAWRRPGRTDDARRRTDADWGRGDDERGAGPAQAAAARRPVRAVEPAARSQAARPASTPRERVRVRAGPRHVRTSPPSHTPNLTCSRCRMPSPIRNTQSLVCYLIKIIYKVTKKCCHEDTKLLLYLSKIIIFKTY